MRRLGNSNGNCNSKGNVCPSATIQRVGSNSVTPTVLKYLEVEGKQASMYGFSFEALDNNVNIA